MNTKLVALVLQIGWLGTTAGASAQNIEPVPDGKNSAQVFFSGHSLIDNPMPDWVELIAKSQGKKLDWEEQIVLGSPVRIRTRGDNAQSAGWDGYSGGKNRKGTGLNVVKELRQPTRIGTGRSYDTLVLAENHRSLDAIVWENSVGYLRHFHDRLLDGNPQARTLYVHTWLEVDKNNPAPWIEHEKSASTVWQCVAEKVRLTLKAENRPANLSVVPAGVALVSLVQKVLNGEVAAISGSDRQKLDKIFQDNVHLTDAGIYFVAAVHYAAIYRQTPQGAAAPPKVPAALAIDLQRIAWDVTQEFMKQEAAHPPSMAECRQVIVEKLCRTYWPLIKESGKTEGCQSFFAEAAPRSGGNPFVWPDPNWAPLSKPSF